MEAPRLRSSIHCWVEGCAGNAATAGVVTMLAVACIAKTASLLLMPLWCTSTEMRLVPVTAVPAGTAKVTGPMIDGVLRLVAVVVDVMLPVDGRL